MAEITQMPKNDNKPISVMLVDDSAVVRQTLTQVLDSDPDIEVIEACHDPYIAAQKLRDRLPDVVILDIEMPRMDGLTFLKKIMSQHPLPVIICSTMVKSGSNEAMESLEYGAVEIIKKPTVGAKKFLEETRVQLCDSVKAAANATVKKISARSRKVAPKLSADAVLEAGLGKGPKIRTENIIVIGASTGGTEAVRSVLERMPENAPGIVVVQHMPSGFTTSFAERLNEICALEVREAADGDHVEQGLALIAPGGLHTLLKRRGKQYSVEVKDGPLVSRHRPSVDVLFRSAARYAGSNATAAILTGMGDDGATGMKEMHDAGAYTIAQDKNTSVVYGMPAVAVEKGGVDMSLPIQDIAEGLLSGRDQARQSSSRKAG